MLTQQLLPVVLLYGINSTQPQMVKCYNSSQETHLIATERHLPCGITVLPAT